MNFPPQSLLPKCALQLCRARTSLACSSFTRSLPSSALGLASIFCYLPSFSTSEAQESPVPQANFLEEVSPSEPTQPTPQAESSEQNPNQQSSPVAPSAPAQQAGQQTIQIELDANSPLLDNPRPTTLAREERAIYLADILSPQARILFETTAATPVYHNSQADYTLDNLRAGTEAELLAFTEHGLLVRANSATGNGLALGWIGKRAAADLQPELLAQLTLMHERQNLVNALIEAREVALGMTSSEVQQSLGRPDQQTLRETVEGISGIYSWVKTRRIPIYETFRDRRTGQRYRRIVDYEIIETSRTNVEFENGLVSAIERSEDRRRNRELPTNITPPLLVTW